MVGGGIKFKIMFDFFKRIWVLRIILYLFSNEYKSICSMIRKIDLEENIVFVGNSV